MTALTTKRRNALSKGEFVFPGERAYPIDTEARARNALARGSQYESGDRLAKIHAAVKRKFPQIHQEHMQDRKNSDHMNKMIRGGR